MYSWHSLGVQGHCHARTGLDLLVQVKGHCKPTAYIHSIYILYNDVPQFGEEPHMGMMVYTKFCPYRPEYSGWDTTFTSMAILIYNPPTRMSLGGWRKLENPKETHRENKRNQRPCKRRNLHRVAECYNIISTAINLLFFFNSKM